MIDLEIILEEKLAGRMESVAGRLGVRLDQLVVMACQKYIQWVERRGLPKITGTKVGPEDESEQS